MRSSYGRDVDISSEPNSEATPGATFIVFRRPGPAWVSGLGSRQQPGWDEHAAFMDGLYESGRVLIGGPYSDFSRVMLWLGRPTNSKPKACSMTIPGPR
jgi:hypothetical protein